MLASSAPLKEACVEEPLRIETARQAYTGFTYHGTIPLRSQRTAKQPVR